MLLTWRDSRAFSTCSLRAIKRVLPSIVLVVPSLPSQNHLKKNEQQTRSGSMTGKYILPVHSNRH